MKVVINNCYGGFGISEDAIRMYASLKGYETFTDKQENLLIRDENNNIVHYWNIKRDDEFLVKTVEILGSKANSRFSNLKIVNIPDDVKWVIEEYDGLEHVAEKHRKWS